MFAEEATAAAAFSWGSIIQTAVVVAITNGIQYYFNKGKTKSETNNLDAHTLALNIESLDKIQKSNQNLFDTLVIIRAQAEKVETDLKETKKKLEECNNANQECTQCKEVLKEVIIELTESVDEMEKLLTGITDSDKLVASFRASIGVLSSKVK